MNEFPVRKSNEVKLDGCLNQSRPTVIQEYLVCWLAKFKFCTHCALLKPELNGVT